MPLEGGSVSLLKMKILLALLTVVVLFANVNGQVSINKVLWPNATIPVDFDPNIINKTRWGVQLAAQYWQERTCLRFLFEDKTIKEPRLLVDSTPILRGSAQIGVIDRGRRGVISLGTREFATKGIIHEMMHVFGWYHTQCRSDSRLYLKNPDRNPKDIMLKPDEDLRFGVPYDHSSAATYDGYGLFDQKYRDSMRSQQSTFYDVLQVNLAYKCFAKCDGKKKPTCQNGGVVDVNNCKKCFCPRQYSGKYCRDRAPPCKRIKVTVRDAPNLCWNDCQHAGLEVFTNVDKRQAGYRYCCPDRLNETVISAGNEMMLDAYTWTSFNETLRRWNTFTFKIDVVAVD